MAEEVQEVDESPQGEGNSVDFATLVAVASHFTALRDRAVANLNTYIFHPAGVGEHPDIVGECISLIEQIDHAESALQTISRISQ